MRNAVSSEALDQIFRTARTYNGWSDTPVDEGIVRDLYDLLKWGEMGADLGQQLPGAVCLGSQSGG